MSFFLNLLWRLMSEYFILNLIVKFDWIIIHKINLEIILQKEYSEFRVGVKAP